MDLVEKVRDPFARTPEADILLGRAVSDLRCMLREAMSELDSLPFFVGSPSARATKAELGAVGEAVWG